MFEMASHERPPTISLYCSLGTGATKHKQLFADLDGHVTEASVLEG